MEEKILTFEEFPAYLEAMRKVSKYDPRKEEMPSHVWFSVDKAAVDGALKELIHTIVHCLRGAPNDDRELTHLSCTAQSYAQVLRSPPIKVALLGAQGAGKSLMINALFDLNQLSLTGAAGGACTSSSSTYSFFPKNETGDDMFHAEILFFKRDKRESMLQEHAANYYFYHNVDDESDNEGEGEANVKPRRASKQDQRDRALKDTAQEIFTTLFGSVDAFHDNWNIPSYKSGEFIRVCQLKCDEALARAGVDKMNIVTEMAADQVKLLKKIKPFLTSVKGHDCLWPLVDNIVVKFHHPLLQQGIEIIDLPGWGDINLSRARHAEEIKDSVDAEMILADSIRIATDEKLVNSARAAVVHHGGTMVKVVTTKIDSLSDNEMDSCDWEELDHINSLIKEVENHIAAIEDEEDLNDEEAASKKVEELGSYLSYLKRIRKQTYIATRAARLTVELSTKLQGRVKTDIPQVFHASASEYMKLTKRSTFGSAGQPALPVEMTGVPEIRQFLYGLPADQNLLDYERHLNGVIPNFVEKIKRTVRETEREAGFLTISDEFDDLRKAFMTRLLSQAKNSFQKSSNIAFAKSTPDIPTFKELLEEKLNEDWFKHKSAAFSRILRSRGVILQGTSKAKGLEDGCNWNRELAETLASGFVKWIKEHKLQMSTMGPSLGKALGQLHFKTTTMINDSSANLVIAEKAKRKWQPLRLQLQAKLDMLMERLAGLEQLTYECAVIQFDKERNFISDLTDDIYHDVSKSEPELKPPRPGSKTQAKRYVTPKLRFQKKVMQHMFLDPDNHFVDRIFKHAQASFDETRNQILDEQFAAMEKLLSDFSADIRSQAPIEYLITPDGEAIRTELSDMIPQLEDKVAAIQGMLPPRPKSEDDQAATASYDGMGGDEGDENLAAIFDKMAKKRKAEATAASRTKRQRIKTELF